MEIFQNLVAKDKEFLEKCFESTKSIDQECEKFFKEIDNFLVTGNLGIFKQLNTGKENVVPNKRRGRQKKPALADITENNLLSLEIKKEKISDVCDKNGDLKVQIKTEMGEMPAPTMLPPRKKKIKGEKPEMPKRSTRSRTKKVEDVDITTSDTESTRSAKDSDVIIQNSTIMTIDISDTDKDTETDTEVESTKNEPVVRSTRSKMRKPNKPEPVENLKTFSEEFGGGDKTVRSTRTKTKQKKRVRSTSMEQPSMQIESKKTKSDSNVEEECNGNDKTNYEDAVSLLENDENKPQAADATYIASSQKSLDKQSVASCINATMVVVNPKIIVKDTDQPESRMSPQKCYEESVASPVSTSKKGTKQIFSPFENTPLKKKVEAFERFGAESSGIPTRVTRTKKKAQKKESELEEESGTKSADEKRNKSTDKEKHRAVTPLTNKFIPKGCSTSKINKLHPVYNGNDISTNNESMSLVRSASALKASQVEFREREKRRQEKERDALRKREALLQAQSEEKRRRREEKQQKAQQQREVLEKEKQKQLEAQRIKEEKYKQAVAEREEKLQKQKEEAEKKRLMVKKKANELLKEKEEMMRIAEQKKQGDITKLKQKMERAQPQSVPIYMVSKPPLLPTLDCYDSDDPEYENAKKYEPTWARGRELQEMQIAMIVVGDTIKNSFFCRAAQTPDLQEIFELIDPKKLKRTSSAIWRKPPRYTLMPTLEDTIEFSEDSDY